MPEFLIKKYNPSWGSHIPTLLKVFSASVGPVLELGTGLFSTPLLHALCMDKNRTLVSYESDPAFFALLEKFVNELHQIKLVEDWDSADIDNIHWGMAFIDHKPEDRRIVDVKRLAGNCDYIIIHDSEGRQNSHYHYDLIYPLFKYRAEFAIRNYAHTTILTNLKDPKKL